MTPDLTAQRKARARAFIRQERAKWQRSWADLRYDYSDQKEQENEEDGSETVSRVQQGIPVTPRPS